MNRFPWVYSLVSWCVLILIVTLIPGNRIPDLEGFTLMKGFDLVVHFILFLCFAILCAGSFRYSSRYKGMKRILLQVLIPGIIFGCSTEFLQFILPIHRDASLIDLLADFSGLIAGLATALGFLPSKST